MRRGTTPTLVIEVDGIDVEEADSFYLYIKQGNTLITKEKDDITINEDNSIEVKLTQTETLGFSASPISIQFRALFGEDAVASDIVHCCVEDVLKGGVIE